MEITQEQATQILKRLGTISTPQKAHLTLSGYQQKRIMPPAFEIRET